MDKWTSGQVNKLLVDRVNKRQSNKVSGQVNEWTSERVACYKEKLVLMLLCLSIILSFLASNSLTCLLAFPHPEKTLHSLKQITLKSIQKTSSRATLQKGVSKRLKGHLLQAKRALIRMELTPFWFLAYEII